MIIVVLSIALLASNLFWWFLLKESNKDVDELRNSIPHLKERIKKLESDKAQISRERASIMTENEKLKSIMGGFPVALIIERNEKEMQRLNEEIILRDKRIEEIQCTNQSAEIDRLFDRVMGR